MKTHGHMRTLVLALGLVICGCSALRKTPRTLEVRYVGNEALSETRIDTVLERFFKDFADARFKKSAVDDAAFDIERAYLAAGFPEVRVDYTFKEREAGLPLAEFTIHEGQSVEFEEAVFEGATAFSKSELEAFFAPPTSGLLEESNSAYVESNVKAAANELELAYTTRGYIEARVEIERVDLGPDGSQATAHVRVHEGPLCRITTLAIEGADPRIDPRALAAVREAFLGKPYYERLSIEIQGRIEEACAKAGFGDVRVTRTGRIVTSAGTVDLVFQVDSGPEITIGDIQVAGNVATRSGFVRSRLALSSGDIYARDKERTSFGRLYRSGVFDRVSIRTLASENEDKTSGSVTRDMRVDVSESPAIETFLEPGYGSYEQLRVAAGARHKNLFGTGRILDFHGVLALQAQRGELSLIDPWLFESDVVAELSLFGNRRREPSFLRIEQGLGATLTRRFSRTVEGAVGYRLRSSKALDVDLLDTDALEAINQVDISELQTSFAHDARDSVFQPTKGSFSKVGVEYASSVIGSELEFARFRAQHATFLPLNSATVLGLSAKIGLVLPLAATDSIPLQERFFNGGENTVRSFRESELGPKDDFGEPLGGESFTAFSIELRRRLRGRFEGAVFYDIGNVTPQYEDTWQFEGYEQAIGVGLRYSLPVGPVRLDVATNPRPGDFESRVVVHVSLGMSF
ncbi:MAG: BamA/TamA family outer membrane protein [Planctomycetota bacterium]|nr:BamA/TamA family outer membrane protein [Planctomycetota bacterium]